MKASVSGVKARQDYPMDEAFAPLRDTDEAEGLMPFPDDTSLILKPHKTSTWRWPMKLLLLAFLSLVMVQTGLGLMNAFEQSPWLFGFYTLVLSIVMGCAGIGAMSEWRKLKKLQRVHEHQETGLRLAQSMQMGEADKFISPLLAQYPANAATRQYLSAISPEHNDAEKVLLFDGLVLSHRDIEAKKLVAGFAAEAALLLAASPLATLDMGIILWRNQRMIGRIASVYGIELGYWSRIKLLRSIVVNIIYAGSAEVITDLGTQLLSVEMAGKLSTRIAQGLGGGLLTARLGYQAMSLCRPLAFSADNKPRLSQIHQQLLSKLTSFSMDKMMSPQSKTSRAEETINSQRKS